VKMSQLRKVVFVALLSAAATTMAQDKKPDFEFALHGFVSGSLYLQDGSLGPAQGNSTSYANALALTPSTTGGSFTRTPDHMVLSGDVRQTRLNASVAGPLVFAGARPKAVVEFDFLGGFGAGANGDISLTPRLRLAYAELNWGGAHRVQIGQALDLTFAMSANSLSHIGQPLGFGTGNIGYRRPGVFGYHTYAVDSASKVEFAWEVARAQWNDNGGIGAGTSAVAGDAYGFQAGEASAIPAFQARVTYSMGTMFTGFVAGHYNHVNRQGTNSTLNTTLTDLDVVAGAAGAKLVYGPLTLQSCAFTGKNTGPLSGLVAQQYQANSAGDVHEYGFWGQAGYNITKEFSAWALAGYDKPNENDALKGKVPRLSNTTMAGMLQYRDGGYALGLEYVRFSTFTRAYATTQATPTSTFISQATANAANAAAADNITGNQVILTGIYYF
jgi:hypothetical protein